MTTNILTTAAALSDRDLLARLDRLATNERHASVDLVAHLAALEARPTLYEGLGFGSLFEYCTAVLRLSEDAACTRIAVAGACRRCPVILDLLATGETNLTNIRRLARHLTPESHEAILARAVNRTRQEIEVLLRELDPQPDLRSSVRRAAAPDAPRPPASAPPPSLPLPVEPASWDEGAGERPSAEVKPTVFSPPRPTIQPSAPERYHVKFTIGAETHRRLRRVQTLLRREIPDGDPGAIFDRALALLLEKVEKQKLGATANPGSGRSIRPRTDRCAGKPPRHIPNEVKREVSKRDGDRCAFVASTGRRCDQRAFLEFHHVQPFAMQGPATVDNIVLHCRRHNRYEAEQEFGPFDPSVVRETSPAYGESQPGLERVRNLKTPFDQHLQARAWTWRGRSGGRETGSRDTQGERVTRRRVPSMARDEKRSVRCRRGSLEKGQRGDAADGYGGLFLSPRRTRPRTAM